MESIIKRLIDKHEFISFDIFGTLIQRDVDETDIYNIISRKYKCDNFVEKRVLAEKKAYEKNKYYSIYDIYAEFLNEDIDDLIAIENSVQIEVAQPSRIGREIFKYAEKQNKKIIVISDMYLSKEIIIKMLRKCGYYNIPKECIYVSNEEKASKKNGNIYNEVLHMLGIEKKQIMHIGDAWRSDFINPIKSGIRAVHFTENVYKVQYAGNDKYKKERQNMVISRFIYNHMPVVNDNFAFGYECLGPLIYGFIKWLKRNNIEKYDTTFFLAREGKIFLDAYQCIEKNEKQQYLLVSRKSLVQTLLWKRTLMEKIEMLPLPEYFSIDKLFDYLGIKEPENLKKKNIKKIKKSDLKKEKTILDFLISKEDEINKFSREQYKLFMELLPQNTKSVALIDIGWKGTMQHYLTEIFNDSNIEKIHGFYLGVSCEGLEVFSNEKKSGYLFEGTRKKNVAYLENTIFSFSGLLEATLTAQHGSVYSYYKNQYVQANLYVQDCNNFIVEEMQKGALQFVKDAVCSVAIKDIELEPTIAADKLVRIGNYPRKRELKNLACVSFFDTENNRLIKKLSWHEMKYGFKINFNNSKWKIGFMRINFPFLPLLPQIYTASRKFRKKLLCFYKNKENEDEC